VQAPSKRRTPSARRSATGARQKKSPTSRRRVNVASHPPPHTSGRITSTPSPQARHQPTPRTPRAASPSPPSAPPNSTTRRSRPKPKRSTPSPTCAAILAFGAVLKIARGGCSSRERLRLRNGLSLLTFSSPYRDRSTAVLFWEHSLLRHCLRGWQLATLDRRVQLNECEERYAIPSVRLSFKRINAAAKLTVGAKMSLLKSLWLFYVTNLRRGMAAFTRNVAAVRAATSRILSRRVAKALRGWTRTASLLRDLRDRQRRVADGCSARRGAAAISTLRTFSTSAKVGPAKSQS
jgi:hypothetical protein